MPGNLSHGVRNSNQGAPWNHLYAFDSSATSRNRRNLRGLEITPVQSAYTTARASPDDAVSLESGIWQPPHFDESFKVLNSTYYVERSHAIPFVPRVSSPGNLSRLGDEPNSGISPTSGAQAWPSPPDSGVVFVSSDSFANSTCAGIAETYGLSPPELVPHWAQEADQEAADPQPRRALFYEQSQQERIEDCQPAQERRTSSDTGYETTDQEPDGLPQYQLDDHPDHQDDVELKPLREQPGETRVERPGIEGSCEHFHPDVASSFPPTAGCFPDYWPVKPNTRSVRHSRSTSGPFAFRPSTRNPRATRNVSVPTVDIPLSVIHEYRKSAPNPSQKATRKGRRAGPLSKAKATQAAMIRKNKSVCIRCKMMKQSVSHRVNIRDPLSRLLMPYFQCSGEVPCLGCRENLGAKIWKSPCVRADFLDIVEAGSCNFICERLDPISHIFLLIFPSATAYQSFHTRSKSQSYDASTRDVRPNRAT